MLKNSLITIKKFENGKKKVFVLIQPTAYEI